MSEETGASMALIREIYETYRWKFRLIRKVNLNGPRDLLRIHWNHVCIPQEDFHLWVRVFNQERVTITRTREVQSAGFPCIRVEFEDERVLGRWVDGQVMNFERVV